MSTVQMPQIHLWSTSSLSLSLRTHNTYIYFYTYTNTRRVLTTYAAYTKHIQLISLSLHTHTHTYIHTYIFLYIHKYLPNHGQRAEAVNTVIAHLISVSLYAHTHIHIFLLTHKYLPSHGHRAEAVNTIISHYKSSATIGARRDKSSTQWQRLHCRLRRYVACQNLHT